MTKEDETTPGPVYNPRFNDSKLHHKNKFGAGRHEIAQPKLLNNDRSEYCRETPGHVYNLPNYWDREHIKDGVMATVSQESIHNSASKLSNGKSTQSTTKGFAVPKQKRGATLTEQGICRGDIRPTATSYENTNEIMRKHVMRFPGQTAIGNGARKVDFAKYSSVHSELVAKGLL